MSKKIVVIGGSAAGPKTAAKARRMDQEADITIIQKEPTLSMASCGYPYYVGGFVEERNQLLSTGAGVVRDENYFQNVKGIKALTQTEVTQVDAKTHTLQYKNLLNGETATLSYDKLIMATGSKPVIPSLPGNKLKGITTLHSLSDADYIRKIRDKGKVNKAVVIGGGLIGIETCEALQQAGIKITVVEMLPQLLSFLDWELAKLLENHVKSKAANVITNNAVAEFIGNNGILTGVKLKNGIEIPCELAVIAVGVRPNVDLAMRTGLKIGDTGGIAVNEFLQTSEPDIYAVGDCIEVTNLITGRKVFAPFGDLANLQGRIAGQNVILGNHVQFPGTFQTGICKVFDYAAGSTGLSESAAQKLGYDNIVSALSAGPDKPGFMGGSPLYVKMVADRKTGRILGVQCIGPGDVSKRIATAAMAIQGKLTVHELVNADLPYAPPFSSAIDNLITAAHVLENKMLGRMESISSLDLKNKLDAKKDFFLLDVRGPSEFEEMRLGVGESLIPVGTIRQRLNELPKDKEKEIICYCKVSLRGYEAANILQYHGWKNVKVVEGGIISWPFAREK